MQDLTTPEASEAAEWQFRLDRRSLGVIHLRAIARIYGDHGGEMLEVRARARACAHGACPCRI